jgi:glutamyl-tRNA reductase
MPFVAAGVEHSTAPLAVREAVSPDSALLSGARESFGLRPTDEVVVVTTCNRTEIYVHSDDADGAIVRLTDWMVGRSASAEPFIRVWPELEAVEHLFRVASGLESQVPGEDQVLSQVADALDVAQRLGTTGPNTHALFRSAVSCGRRARQDTALGHVERSIGTVAVLQAESRLGGLDGRSVLVVGGGEVSRLVVRELVRRKPADLVVANRTIAVAEEIAGTSHGRAASLDDLPALLARADVAFSATAARGHVIAVDDLGSRVAGRPLLLYDLASPRDIDPAVGGISDVTLVDLDGLDGVTLERWAQDVRTIEAVVAAEMRDFEVWMATRRVAPVIAGLRRHVEAVSRAELQRAAPQLADLTSREYAAVETLTNRLIDKMFHHLVMRLRLAAQTDPALVDAAEFFFLHGPGGLFEDESARSEQVKTEVRGE